tara:strand:- start:2359 stop:3189 length:831 start_codon:yes stop_codon:yes gene_type:complete
MAIKISVQDFNPSSVASLRLIIGALFLYIFFKSKNIKTNFSYNIYFLIFIIALLGNFIPFYLISWSEQYIQSNTAGLLLSIAPILALIFSHFFTRDDKFTIRKFISIIIGLIGVFFIIGFDTFGNFSFFNDKNFIPKIAVIIAAFGYVISSILAYNLKEIDILSLTTYVTIFAAIISLPFLLYYEINFPSNFSSKSIFAILYLGLFPTAIAFLLRFHLISVAGPIFLSYVAYLIPIFAIIWGFIFLRETISINSLIGIVLVLFGVFVGKNKLVKIN